LIDHGISGLFRFFKVLDTRITRVRRDSVDYQFLQEPDILMTSEKYSSDKYLYEFYDNSFRDLTYGTYTYELEIDFIDPAYEFIEKIVPQVKNLLSRFNQAITYIHNNPQNYNELRDELNTAAQSDLRVLFPLSESSGDFHKLFSEAISFDILFKAMTGESYVEIANLAQDSEVDILDVRHFERRKLENSKRIIEDLLHAASKFFSIASINNSYASSAKNPSKVITYSRTWDEYLSPRAFKNGVTAILEQNSTGLSELEYQMRMEYEKGKHNVSINVDSKNLGFMTPNTISGKNIFGSDDPIKRYLNIFANILERGDVVDSDLANALLDTNPDGYNGTVQELINSSGMFESFLETLGGTVENTTIDSIDTKVETNKRVKRIYSSGIDNGENLVNAQSSNFGRIEVISDDDLESINEKRTEIKQDIFLEKVKIEDVVMRMLINRDGYSILDRQSFIQGEKNSRSFDYNFNYSSIVEGRANPVLHYSTEKYFRLSENGKGSEISMPLARLILDNTYVVFYLAGFDENMNPDWRQLSNFENVRQVSARPSNETGGTLCKLKRFQDSKMQIGQGSTSDREILSRYFYLYLD